MNRNKIPTHNEIIANGNKYSLLDKVKHKEIKPFVINELKNNQGWAVVLKIYNIMALLLMFFTIAKATGIGVKSGDYTYLFAILAGAIFSFTGLIIIHELIHGIAYLLIGAKRLSIEMKLSKMLLFVQSDRSVLDYKKFRKVALAPAIIISAITIIVAIIFFGKMEYYFCLTILSIHSIFCGGDFGLLAYFENRDKDSIYKFDDVESKTTYFYTKNNI